MSSVDLSNKTEAAPEAEPVDMKLKVVLLGVSNVDRAKAFYENLCRRLDGDFTAGDDFRIVQLTPHNSEASIIFGKGFRSAEPGLADSRRITKRGRAVTSWLGNSRHPSVRRSEQRSNRCASWSGGSA